uniref:SH3 domain-containing protein n=1 Tax=Kalanchoe fedtschenkoi TaxID=63787 RepID=A0A7N0TSI3_KALFE
MDLLKRQASKIREQVAKQQQAVVKQLGGSGYQSSNAVVLDEEEMIRHQQLEKLYRSTRVGKEFQREIVKATEAFTGIGVKHMETGMKLSENCCKYGSEHFDDNILGKAAYSYGEARRHVEKEQEDLNKHFRSQILDPLKAMVNSAPLEEARHLAQRYSRMRQEAQDLGSEILRRQARVKEAPIPENIARLQSAESKLHELKTNMAVLGKEAAAALSAVAALAEGEKTCYLRMAAILGNVETEMVSVKQKTDAAPPVIPTEDDAETAAYFLAEAMHPFTAESKKELSFEKGDYVVVRRVDSSGWSEGEFKGRAGWFPSAYVRKRNKFASNNKHYKAPRPIMAPSTSHFFPPDHKIDGGGPHFNVTALC